MVIRVVCGFVFIGGGGGVYGSSVFVKVVRDDISVIFYFDGF